MNVIQRSRTRHSVLNSSFVVVTDRSVRSDGEWEVVADPRVVPADRDLRRGDRAGRGRHHQGAAGRAAVPARHRPTGPRPLHRHHQVLHATQPGFIQRQASFTRTVNVAVFVSGTFDPFLNDTENDDIDGTCMRGYSSNVNNHTERIQRSFITFIVTEFSSLMDNLDQYQLICDTTLSHGSLFVQGGSNVVHEEKQKQYRNYEIIRSDHLS